MLRYLLEARLTPRLLSISCRLHLHGSDTAVIRAILCKITEYAVKHLVSSSEPDEARVILELLTRKGLIGWTNGHMPFIFCELDNACGGAAASVVGLEAKLVQLATSGSKQTAEDAAFLARQLFMAKGQCKEGLLQILDFMRATVEAQHMDQTQPDVIYLLVRGIAFHHPRNEAWDKIWMESGIVKQILTLMDDASAPKAFVRTALKCIFSLSRVPLFKRHLRDNGALGTLTKLYERESKGQKHDWDEDISKILFNLSEDETLLNSLRSSDAMSVQVKIVTNHPGEKDAARLFALLCLSHMYGVEASDHPVQKLLSEQDISTFLHAQLKEAIEKGVATIFCAGFEVFHSITTVCFAIQSVAANAESAQAMHKAGVIELLVKVAQGHRKESVEKEDSPIETLSKVARGLLNFSYVKSLRPLMVQMGVAEALKPHLSHADLRIADAASGCVRNLEGKDDGLDSVTAAISCPSDPKFDVFLSHKRTDAKDFARALYNLLDVRGIRSFLDYEYREELSRLEDIVGQCTNFVFVLTDNIFDSKWCLIELEAAVKYGVNIILLVKDGARWPDEAGNMICNFPPYHIINSLPEGCRSAFDSKALTHSDE
jgi:hypothetical protein